MQREGLQSVELLPLTVGLVVAEEASALRARCQSPVSLTQEGVQIKQSL